MDKSLHSLICSSVSLLDRGLICKILDLLYGRSVNYLNEQLSFCLLIAVIVGKCRNKALFFQLVEQLLGDSLRIIETAEQIERSVDIVTVSVLECLGNACSHIIIELRDRLTAVLVVLIGLDSDAGKSSIACNVVRSSQVTVTCGKALCEQLSKVDLCTGRSKGIEIHIVNVDIALCVRLSVHRIKHIHLIEFLSADRTVLEHGAHSSISVDICVFTLKIGILGRLECKILIALHKPCVHLSCTSPLGSVQDICLSGGSVSLINKDVLNAVLDLLNGRRSKVFLHEHINDLAGEDQCLFLI